MTNDFIKGVIVGGLVGVVAIPKLRRMLTPKPVRKTKPKPPVGAASAAPAGMSGWTWY